MAPRDRAVDRASLRTARDLSTIARELRAARLMRGLTQAAVGRSAGISGQYVGRLERDEAHGAAPVVLGRAAAAVGLELSIRVFPTGAPVRDAGHIALLDRLRRRLGPMWRWHLEVPVGSERGSRAWDAVAEATGVRLAFEAETRLYDIQAQVRRMMAKLTSSDVDRLIIGVADTRTNRQVLREVRGLLRDDFPLDTRAVMGALAGGFDPGANGIVVL